MKTLLVFLIAGFASIAQATTYYQLTEWQSCGGFCEPGVFSGGEPDDGFFTRSGNQLTGTVTLDKQQVGSILFGAKKQNQARGWIRTTAEEQ